ncbi:dihydrodipicolinate synthase [Emydomyces testavorans]|uniref:Dihydrodipicolinate synthase n=1 Tax=Emydomyces testavorans TaxID=2070801 RepID=A0AAF0DF01_9EURO|nr:dihydrodipicolinate synthase [Emydomyces testavorans]
MAPRVPQPGVWCPAVTFFDLKTDTVDLAAQEKYYAYLSRTGLTGLVILGTNAETFLLTREERAQLITTARKAVGPDFPLMAGVSGHSTRQVLEHIGDAVRAGANYVLVLPPAYFGKATTTSVIKSFFDDVSCQSPLPVVIYNFPGVCNGIDLDSELITTIARKDPNIVGVKLTCGSVGKITRLAATFPPEDFSIFGGQSDFLIGGLSVGSAGCVSAFANVFPKTICRIYQLYKAGKVDEALKLQGKAALAESPCKSGIATTKYAASIFSAKAAGIEDAEVKLLPRRPYDPPSEAIKENVRIVMAEIADIEAGL